MFINNWEICIQYPIYISNFPLIVIFFRSDHDFDDLDFRFWFQGFFQTELEVGLDYLPNFPYLFLEIKGIGNLKLNFVVLSHVVLLFFFSFFSFFNYFFILFYLYQFHFALKNYFHDKQGIPDLRHPFFIQRSGPKDRNPNILIHFTS